MPFIIVQNEQAGSGSTVEIAASFDGVSSFTGFLNEPLKATFAGVSSFVADLNVVKGIKANFGGVSGFSAQLSGISHISADFEGASGFGASLRFNDEPNVFLDAVFEGRSDFAVAPFAGDVEIFAGFGGQSSFTANLSIIGTVGETTTTFEEYLPSTGSFAMYGTARLLCNGSEVPITGFDYNEAAGEMGGELSVDLAVPDKSLIPLAGDFTFQIGLWNGTSVDWETLVSGGKLQGRNYTVGITRKGNKPAPTDSLSFSARESLKDKWNLAPENPTTIYDGTKVEMNDVTDTTNAVFDYATKQAILPVNERRDGLNLYFILDKVYVEQCGFASVKTNIPNYPISRVDITPEAGWHGSIAGLVGMFRPKYTVDADNNLWITYAGAPLPGGFTPISISLANYQNLSESLPILERTNALYVSYKVDITADGVDHEDVTRTEPIKKFGTFGDANYKEIHVTRTVTEYFPVGERTNILASLEKNVTTTIVGQYASTFGTMQSDVLQVFYDSTGRKTGHHRTVESLVPVPPDGTLQLTTTQIEDSEVSYRQNPLNPSESIEDYVVTRVQGSVLTKGDEQYQGEDFKMPLVDAHRNGEVDYSSNQTLSLLPIRTKIEQYQVRNDGQATMLVTEIDEIANTTSFSEAEPRVGDLGVKPRKELTKTVLLRVPGTTSDGRRIPIYSTGEVPPTVAIELGKQELNRRNKGLNRYSLALTGVHTGIKQGSVVIPEDRSAPFERIFVESRRISGRDLGTRRPVIEMSIQAEELPSSEGI